MTSGSTFRSRAALVVALSIAAAAFAPAALADTATPVTFEANNPWAQEVATLSHDQPSHAYSVSVDAGKTLHLKLYSRNPNLFIKVRNDTLRKDLVDTAKTGATTWSEAVTAPTTFSIRVYVEPSVMERGESAKYALQVGAYGAADLRPASTAVTFQPGQPWAQELGRIDAGATAHDYTVAVAAGNTLQVNLIAKDTNIHFKVLDASDAALVDTASTPAAASGTSTWSTAAASAATYTIRVYADAASVPPGAAFGYAVQIGQYPTNRAQPPAAGSVAAPTPASAPASSATP